MLLKENILLALAGLKANKMRSFLTMLGIIIGIASVIAIMTVGDAVNHSVTSSMGDIGANNIEFYLTYRDDVDWESDVPSITAKDNVSEEMLESVAEKFQAQIKAISLNSELGSGTVTHGKSTANIRIMGANTGYLTNQNMKLLAGRELYADEQKNGKKVIMVSDKYVDSLYHGDMQAALGESAEVNIDGKYYSYTIVGVYEYKPTEYSMSGSGEPTTNGFIPLKTANQQAHMEENYNYFIVIAREDVDSSALSNQISAYMTQRYYSESNYFEIDGYSMEAMLTEMTSMISTIQLAIAAIAGISLLVGGIGVMNIMIVSITERTREIGTRKALGATNGSIRLQFITEAVVICLIGGIIGIIFGVSVGLLIVKVMGYSGMASPGSILFCVSFSMAFGIFFGYYPASRAAKMNPIEALRYE